MTFPRLYSGNDDELWKRDGRGAGVQIGHAEHSKRASHNLFGIVVKFTLNPLLGSFGVATYL